MARIGIDLGTTNSVVAMVYDDGAHVVPRGRGRVIPSAVFFRGRDGSDVVVGEEAERWMAEGRVVRSVKRLMGRTHAQALAEKSDRYFPPTGGSVRLVRRGENDLGLALGDGAGTLTLWPHEVSAWVLREARAHAERGLGRAIEAAAITVPAYFRDAHRGGDARRRAPGRPRGVGRPAGRARRRRRWRSRRWWASGRVSRCWWWTGAAARST